MAEPHLKKQVEQIGVRVDEIRGRAQQLEGNLARERSQRRTMEVSAVVAAAVAIIGFSFYLGGLNKDVEVLNARVDALQPDAVREARQDALDVIASAKEKALAELGTDKGVPVGSMVAWPGPLPPADDAWHSYWRPCDGKDMEFNKRLWDILRGNYGNPDAEMVVRIKLPDFQGYFLRGLDRSGDVDPDGASRKFGLPQSDVFESHYHGFGHFMGPAESHGRKLVHENRMNEGQVSQVTQDAGGDETRPKNMVVHWVIRVN